MRIARALVLCLLPSLATAPVVHCPTRCAGRAAARVPGGAGEPGRRPGARRRRQLLRADGAAALSRHAGRGADGGAHVRRVGDRGRRLRRSRPTASSTGPVTQGGPRSGLPLRSGDVGVPDPPHVRHRQGRTHFRTIRSAAWSSARTGSCTGRRAVDFPSAAPARYGSVYRVDPITGAGDDVARVLGGRRRRCAIRLAVSSRSAVSCTGRRDSGESSGPMARQLGQGGIYRLDPTTGTVATVHLFNGTNGRNPMVGLTRTTDGWLYGTAFQHFSGGAAAPVTFFASTRRIPMVCWRSCLNPTGRDSAARGSLAAGRSGRRAPVRRDGAWIRRIFRVRRQPGGAHTVETVHGYDRRRTVSRRRRERAGRSDSTGSSMATARSTGGRIGPEPFSGSTRWASAGGSRSVHRGSPFLQNGHDLEAVGPGARGQRTSSTARRATAAQPARFRVPHRRDSRRADDPGRRYQALSSRSVHDA